jgi:radical SAM superfamily enzyme YgiQ (UPF0313 family)
MICLEDGITSNGFRKIAAYVSQLNPDTRAYYISTNHYRSLLGAIRGDFGGAGELDDADIDLIASELADADVVGYSSMTGYADLTRRVIARLREISPSTFQIWGGIHPIIHPVDAIQADVDAICIGEGEYAFRDFFDAFSQCRDFLDTRNFWFKRNGEIIRNGFLPLFTPEALNELPFPIYGDKEWIFKSGAGFMPLGLSDYLATNGLGYSAIWSIGCPLHCTFCGNTKFIANDPQYRIPRYPSAQYIVDEVRTAREKMPHISTVNFHDDSFMAIRLHALEEFAELWREQLGIPFAVYGVIPNYVNRDKFEVLTWAGMNRIRMGVQSGSREILKFYRRPTPIEKIEAGAEVIADFSPKYHIAPAYDIIMDNPLETRQDVVDTLELLYRFARPFTLLIYSLKVIPNTQLEKQMIEAGVDLDSIDANYSTIPARVANIMLYMITLFRPPRWLWEKMLARVDKSTARQQVYPKTAMFFRALYVARRAFSHLRFMDFSIIPGWMGYVFWRIGLVGFWQDHVVNKFPKPPKRSKGHPKHKHAGFASEISATFRMSEHRDGLS